MGCRVLQIRRNQKGQPSLKRKPHSAVGLFLKRDQMRKSWFIIYITVAIVILIVGSSRGQDKKVSSEAPNVQQKFSELEQVKLLNLYRKSQESIQSFDTANCRNLATAAKADDTAFQDYKKLVLKAHNLPEATVINLDLDKDTAIPTESSASKK
jgi:hypothetical protein